MPIYTSSLRELKESEKVIEFWEENGRSFHNYESSALFTSLASAYCDINDLTTAKKYIDRAYARSGANSNGYNVEISLVYKRINKELEKGKR